MISNNCFVVEINQAYNNEKDFGGLKLVLNTNVDDASYVNRVGILKALPFNYDGELEIGMKVIVHHNIARLAHDYQGIKINQWYIKGDLYRVPYELLYLYEKDGEWKAYGEYCFVKPMEAEKVEKIGSIYIPENAQSKYQALFGYMAIPNKNLDVDVGEAVIYKKNSEHKYEIGGELMYKMKYDRVLCKVPNYHG